jgi:Leucine-rich repeat (LRR) protein
MTPAGRARMPYIGLRPFDEQDEPLFFGREDQVSRTLHQLEDHPFLAVVGPSGSGKSSIVRAGLLPAIRQGFLLGRVDWAIFVFTPGPQPYERLARLIARDPAAPGAASSATATSYADVLAALRSGDQGLAAALTAAGAAPDTPILIVVDQFEELFAFRRQQALRDEVAMRDEAAGFVRMLLRGCAAEADRLRVVITMRSDFIGDTEAFLGLPEAISRSQFLVPRVTRHQMEDIIVRPSTVTTEGYAPFSFEAALVNRISNDAGDRSDQLPLMQHALMRTWKLAVERAAGAPVRLTHDDYRTAGGIDNALSFHADMAWSRIERDPDLARVAKRLFLLLCDVSPDGQITRRRPRVAEVELVTGATIEQIATVLRTFQEDDRNFLLPLVSADLTPETTLDISHESLIRQWKLFDTWLLEERHSAATFQRLQVAARAWPDREPLLRDPALTLALTWVKEQAPTAPWAARYGGDLDRVLQFLTASEQARADEREAADALRQKEIDDAHRREAEQSRSARRFRWATLTLALVSLLAVGALIIAEVNRRAVGELSENLNERESENARLAAEKDELSQQKSSLSVDIERQRIEQERLHVGNLQIRDEMSQLVGRSARLESQQKAFGAIGDAHGIVARASDGTAIVTFRESSIPPDAALPILAQIGPVSALSLSGTSVTDAALSALPELTNLKILDLASTDISDAGVRSIVRMTSLQDLSLADTLISEASLLMLPSLPNLRSLNLSRTRVSSPEVALLRTRMPRATITYIPDVFLEALSASGGDLDVALAAANGSRTSGTLSFHKSEISNAALRALGDYETVTLAYCRNLTNDTLRTLARRPKLRRLRLESNSQMTDQGIEHLRTSNVTHLDLEDLAITDRSLASLSQLASLEALRISSVSQEITDAGVASLPALRSLKQFALEWGSMIGPSSVQTLAKIPTLEAIALIGANVPGDAYAALADLPRLRVLDISGSDKVTDDHIGALNRLTRLEQLNVTGTDISAAGRTRLRSANPRLRDRADMTKVGEIPVALADYTAPLDPVAVRALATDGRTLSPLRPITGELRRTPSVGGRSAQAWDFPGCTGKWAQIDLKSDDFDPFLMVVGTTTPFADSNDDADALNSRLEFPCRETGYKLLVSAVGESVGAFRLSVQLRDEPSPDYWRQPSDGMIDAYRALDVGGRSVALGSDVSGTLGEPVQAWTLRGCQNNRVRVGLRSSDFDSLLAVVSSSSPFLEHNDDFGSTLNSRVEFDCTDAEYKVVVATLDGATGAFDLNVSVAPDTDALLGTLETVGREVVDQLSTAGRELRVGSTMRGELTNTVQLANTPAQAWLLRGCQGQRVVVDLRSDDFDAYLIVSGTRLPFLERDDDGGEDLNSRLEFLCEDSDYRVVVGTLDDLGAFELSVSRASATEPASETLGTVERDAVDRLPTAGRILGPGSTVNGELTSTSRLANEAAQAWILRGCQGRRVVIDLQSTAFDAYLIVSGTRVPFLGRDDDSGDGLNSRLEFLCEDTEYKVVVSTLDDLGAFQLSVALRD